MTPEESFLEGVAAQKVAHLLERGNLGEFDAPNSRMAQLLVTRAAAKARHTIELPPANHLRPDRVSFNNGVAAQKVVALLQNGNIGEFELPMSKAAHIFILKTAEGMGLRVTPVSFNRFRIQ